MSHTLVKISIVCIVSLCSFITDVSAEPPDYSDYAAVLASYVDDGGLVDYSGLARDRGRLDAFARTLADTGEQVYRSWDADGQLAFWINAYNALTLVAILDNYPIKSSRLKSLRFPKNSIRQIDGVWDGLEFTVLGEEMTLNHIEHEIIRKEFSEPRIHMALVCAAVSCPPLRDEPFSGEKLDRQLDDQTHRFLSHPLKFGIDRDKNRVHLSEILKWFGDDFVEKHSPASGYGDHSVTEKAVLGFIAPFLGPAEKAYLRSGGYSISYLEYDWTLNAQ